MDWKQHLARLGNELHESDTDPDPEMLRERVEPWVSALLQSDHLSVLIGSGLPTAVAAAGGVTAASMGTVSFGATGEDAMNAYAERTANAMGRGAANIEDQLRSALLLAGGLEVQGAGGGTEWREAIDRVLLELASRVLAAERGIGAKLSAGDNDARVACAALVSFLEGLTARAASRERTHVFGLNYDRLIEFGCDLAGLRPLDRFVGALSPRFRASRLDIDLHYNPPGIRGEPRYLEGVLRLSKLHGSLDWLYEARSIRRSALPFGAEPDHPELPASPYDRLLIYPNAAKDQETLEYPYAELFRDFSAALCRPNSALITYGYGFGDDHVNRVVRDMLTLSSTHLLVISYDDCGGRLPHALAELGREQQISLLIGSHFGDLRTFVTHYLPVPGLEPLLARSELLKRVRAGDPDGPRQ